MEREADKKALLRGRAQGAGSESFFAGVLVLSASAVVVKIIGLIYKIPMLKLLGSEGMGYFNSAYELFCLLCVVATTGLPVAMSVTVSARLARGESAEGVLGASMRLFLPIGIGGMLLLLAVARPFASFLGSERAYLSMVAIAPALFFICFCGAYRGYFQGLGKMMPTALSQVAEAVGKLLFGLLLASLALRKGGGTEETAAFATLGLTLGMALATLFLMLCKRRRRGEGRIPDCIEREPHLLLSLLRIAVPVTLSSAVVSLTKVIDMTMILRRLGDGGVDGEDAFALYGNYTTLALPLFALAPTLVTSVAMPLIPALSRAVAEGNRGAQYGSVRDAMKLTAWIAMPISLGLTLFAEPILSLLFAGEAQAIAEATPLLALLGPSVVLSCLITVSNAVLQAYGDARIPILSLTAGSLLKLTLAYFLIGNANVGMLGAPVSTFFCDLLAVAVNFYWIDKRMERTPSVSDTLCRPFAAAFLSVTAARITYHLLLSRIGDTWYVTVACIALAALLYLSLSVLLGAVDIKGIMHKKEKMTCVKQNGEISSAL